MRQGASEFASVRRWLVRHLPVSECFIVFGKKVTLLRRKHRPIEMNARQPRHEVIERHFRDRRRAILLELDMSVRMFVESHELNVFNRSILSAEENSSTKISISPKTTELRDTHTLERNLFLDRGMFASSATFLQSLTSIGSFMRVFSASSRSSSNGAWRRTKRFADRCCTFFESRRRRRLKMLGASG